MFELSGISAGVTRTLAAPNASGTVALTSELGAYLPLTGGTLSGGLSGTDVTGTGRITADDFRVSNNGSATDAAIGNADGNGLFFGTNILAFSTNGTDRGRFESGGRLILGHTGTIAVGGGQANFQIHGTSATASASTTRWEASANGPTFRFGKSRSATIGSFSAVQNNDQLLLLDGCGDDGTNLGAQACRIRMDVDGTVSTGIVPGRIRLETADSAGTLQTVIRCNASTQAAFADGTVSLPSVSFISDLDTGFRRIGANNPAWVAGGVDQASITANGFFALRAVHAPITTVTQTTTLDASHHTVLCDTTNNSITINLPSASSAANRIYKIKKIAALNTVTIDGDGTETIDGSTTLAMTILNDKVTIQSNGTAWWTT